MTTRSLTRRRWLALCFGGAVAGLAGCSSGGDGGDEDGPADADGGDGRSSAGGSGDDGGEAGGDTDGDATGDGGERTGADPEDVDLGTAFEWGPSYVVEVEFSGSDVPELTQTVHEGDVHTVVESEGRDIEAYEVDGEKYEVVEGHCIRRSDLEAAERAPDLDEPDGERADVPAAETTTVDGEPVYVFEIGGEDTRWYVSADAGYPVRLESPGFTATFHSWGETDPISPPEMACQEV